MVIPSGDLAITFPPDVVTCRGQPGRQTSSGCRATRRSRRCSYPPWSSRSMCSRQGTTRRTIREEARVFRRSLEPPRTVFTVLLTKNRPQVGLGSDLDLAVLADVLLHVTPLLLV